VSVVSILGGRGVAAAEPVPLPTLSKLTVAVQESCLCPWSLSWAEEVWQPQSPSPSLPSPTRKMTSQNRYLSIRVKTIIQACPPSLASLTRKMTSQNRYFSIRVKTIIQACPPP
jgi:hypothetical protein